MTWSNFVYKVLDKPIYKLFYWRWNPMLAASREMRQAFMDEFRIWNGKVIEDSSQLATDYAIRWSRTSSAKTNENLAKLFDEAMWEVRNADPRCK